MAYTDTWDAAFNNAPAGGAQISGGDDAIRQTRLAVFERLSDILVDINADPPTLNSAILGTIGAVTSRVMAFGPHILEATNDEDDTRHEDTGYKHNDNGLTSVGSLYFPDGVTIQKVQASMDRSLSPDVTLELFKVNIHTGAKTVLDTVVRAVAGIGLSDGAIANPPGIGEVVDSENFVYGVKFTAGAFLLTNPKCYGILVTVDVPGVQAAV
jgi:hypothetical protein